MNRRSIITRICEHIRSHPGQQIGAYIDVVIPWGNSSRLTVRVQRMTGKCINLHTDMEMLTIPTKVLDAAFAEQAKTEQVPVLSLVGAQT